MPLNTSLDAVVSFIMLYCWEGAPRVFTERCSAQRVSGLGDVLKGPLRTEKSLNSLKFFSSMRFKLTIGDSRVLQKTRGIYYIS